MKNVFIFDMDGVIVNSEPIHLKVEREEAVKYGIMIDEGRWDSFVGVRTSDVWESLIKEENLSLDIDELLVALEEKKVRCLEQSNLQPIVGIVELLQKLKALNFKIALASSSSRVFIEAVLKTFKIDTYFDCVVSGEDVVKGKPAPDIYLETAHRLKVQPNQCYVLEDSKMGIEAANKAGMETIGYQNPGSGNQDLSNAHHVVSSIERVTLGVRPPLH